MNVLDSNAVKGFLSMANDGWLQGWHERNGGNLSYRMTADDINEISENFNEDSEYKQIGTSVPKLANEYFIVTGSGKFFRNILTDPEDSICIIRLDEKGDNYKILWGLINGGSPTSELPAHLMNHEAKLAATDGKHRVIYHAHPANIIALTFILPLDERVFTRELWEMATECPVVFPDGIGVVPWMVPGGRAIAVETSRLMTKYDAAVWAHHGLFCSGENFDITFGLMHTIEKAAEILIKVMSVTGGKKRQTITPDHFRALANDFQVTLSEDFLYEKDKVSVDEM